MKTVYSLKDFKKNIPHPVVTIGIFDGLHRGHRRIIGTLTRRAKVIHGTSVVLTFSPHPAQVLREKPPALLSSLPERQALFASLGVDICVVARFTPSFARKTPEEFVKKVLLQRIGVKEIVIGEGYRFGQGESGTVKFLEDLGRRYGFGVKEIKALKIGKQTVSSTRIRGLISRGDFRHAALLLGRPFSIRGRVIKGKGRGAAIGYPTANILVPPSKILPQNGVYAAWIITSGKRLKGMLNIGTRPTFKGKKLSVEIHIFGFDGRLYGREIEVVPAARLRREKKFKDATTLTKVLDKDARAAMKILKKDFLYKKDDLW